MDRIACHDESALRPDADTMSKPSTFFYGSYMSLDVLAEVDIVPEAWEVARLDGYDLTIGPRANLVESELASVYGIIATASHEELERLYAHARDVLGEVYWPHAVIVETASGATVPALCYITDTMKPGPAAADYVGRIAGPARAYGFPAWYVERIESFAPSA
jgi:hypothetical protein